MSDGRGRRCHTPTATYRCFRIRSATSDSNLTCPLPPSWPVSISYGSAMQGFSLSFRRRSAHILRPHVRSRPGPPEVGELLVPMGPFSSRGTPRTAAARTLLWRTDSDPTRIPPSTPHSHSPARGLSSASSSSSSSWPLSRTVEGLVGAVGSTPLGKFTLPACSDSVVCAVVLV